MTDQALPEWAGPGPHYVVATERDLCLGDAEIYTWDSLGRPVLKDQWLNPPTPIIHEHVMPIATTLANCLERAKSYSGRYGRTAIYRLVLVEVIP